MILSSRQPTSAGTRTNSHSGFLCGPSKRYCSLLYSVLILASNPLAGILSDNTTETETEGEQINSDAEILGQMPFMGPAPKHNG